MNDRISLAPERSGRIYIAGPMTGLPNEDGIDADGQNVFAPGAY